MKERPGIADLMKRQQARRRRLAGRSFEEKIEIIERMRKLQLNRSLMTKHRLKGKDESIRMKTR